MMEEKKAAMTAAQTPRGKDTINSSTAQKYVENFVRNQMRPSQMEIGAHLDALASACKVQQESITGCRELPIDGLSKLVQEYIISVSHSTQSPRDYSVGALMTVAGAAAGKNAKLVLPNGWHDYPCLWCMAVGDPSAGKTPPLREIVQPLKEENKRTFYEYKKAMEAHKASPDSPLPQWTGQVVIGDCTPEARDKALSVNSHGTLIYRDELSAFVKEFGRYNAGSEAETLNSIWVSEGYPINRKTAENMYIEEPFMSILGGIQPDMLAKTFLREDLMASGHAARWLYLRPEPQPPRTWSNEKIPDELREGWSDVVKRLLGMEYKEYRLSEGAAQLYEDFYNQIQLVIADKETSPICQQYLVKLSYYAARWALIVHLLNDMSSPYITAAEMEYTLRCMEYFKRTADEVMALRSSGGGDKRKPTQKELIRMIFDTFPVTSQSALARALGVSQPYINKCLQS